MTEQHPHVEIHRKEGFTEAIFLDREIIHEPTTQRLREELTDLLTANPGIRLLLNFDRVERLSSLALGMLIIVLKRVLSQHGQLKLCNLCPKVHEELGLTKLHRVFDIYDNPEQAVADFAGP